MRSRRILKAASTVAVTFLLAACGGSGGSGPASTPAPVPSPTPTPTPSIPLAGPVDILKSPATQEFAAFSSGDALRIRFDAQSGKYQVMASGSDWDTLIDEERSEPGLALFASAPALNLSAFSYWRNDHVDPDFNYRYSSLASWRLEKPGQDRVLEGFIAFGAPTPAGGVPVAGSASYRGPILGTADIVADGWGWGKIDPAPINGNVTLNFDFTKGSLSGQIWPTLSCDCDQILFPTLDFADTTFGTGSRTFSGRFATSVTGANTFSGRFTGPQAEELIGQWVFPFLFEGAPHSATGVWIAKRGE